MKWIRTMLLTYMPDVCLLAGAVLVVRGLSLIYQPLAWLAAGGVLLFVGWLGTLSERVRSRRGGSS